MTTRKPDKTSDLDVAVFHYPACGTCKKALAYLAQRGIKPSAITDMVASPIDKARLAAFVAASGKPLSAFFNTSGESYRTGSFKARLPAMSDDEKLEALARDGKLVKRPIVAVTRGGKLSVLVGFKQDEYDALL